MISFFTHTGGAGIIRGEQIAHYLDARLNPKSGFEDDICIYVKSIPSPFVPEHTYIDVVEDSAGLRWVKSHPEVGIIASSKSIYEYLKGELKNKIVLIPQHHCNFEREVRTRTRVEVAGIIGNKAAFQYPLDKLERKLNRVGIELRTLIKKTFEDREEVVEFYKQIDIQLIWRPNSDGVLRNPLKLINAMSFGVLTVSYPEADFVAELDGYFSDVRTIDKMINHIGMIKRATIGYEKSARALMEKAEEYHISKIAKLYLDLT